MTVTHLSDKTVAAFSRYCRELVSQNLLEEQSVIGGERMVVEIDGTKMGKRKTIEDIPLMASGWLVALRELPREKSFLFVFKSDRVLR